MIKSFSKAITSLLILATTVQANDHHSGLNPGIELAGFSLTPASMPNGVLGVTTCNGAGRYQYMLTSRLDNRLKACGILRCTAVHEEIHIKHYRLNAPTLCENGRKGEVFQYTSLKWEAWYEGPGYRATDQCYTALLKTAKQPCNRYITAYQYQSRRVFESRLGPLY